MTKCTSLLFSDCVSIRVTLFSSSLGPAFILLLHLPLLSPLSLDGGDYGLDEKDMEASVATVRSLCEQIEADLIWLRERTDTGGKIQDYLIRRRVGDQDFLEVR